MTLTAANPPKVDAFGGFELQGEVTLHAGTYSICVREVVSGHLSAPGNNALKDAFVVT